LHPRALPRPAFQLTLADNNSSLADSLRESAVSRLVSQSEGPRTLLGEDTEETFLCLFLGAGRLGAALYEAATCRLSLFRDTPDGEPDWDILRGLVHQASPQHVIVSTRQDQAFQGQIRWGRLYLSELLV
jgi:hypothetical protein